MSGCATAAYDTTLPQPIVFWRHLPRRLNLPRLSTIHSRFTLMRHDHVLHLQCLPATLLTNAQVPATRWHQPFLFRRSILGDGAPTHMFSFVYALLEEQLMFVLFSHDLYGSNEDRILWRGKFIGVADIFYRGYLSVRWRLWCSTA